MEVKVAIKANKGTLRSIPVYFLIRFSAATSMCASRIYSLQQIALRQNLHRTIVHLLYLPYCMHLLYLPYCMHLLYLPYCMHLLYLSYCMHLLYLPCCMHLLYLPYCMHLLYLPFSAPIHPTEMHSCRDLLIASGAFAVCIYAFRHHPDFFIP